jgi:hypothetical protein
MYAGSFHRKRSPFLSEEGFLITRLHGYRVTIKRICVRTMPEIEIPPANILRVDFYYSIIVYESIS